MITRTGYSKDPSIMPEGIAITWSRDLILEKGGLLTFIRYFEKIMSSEEGIWLQKCKNAPLHDILYVYIIISGQVRYRLYYAGHQAGPTTIFEPGKSWAGKLVSWPRIILGGPFVKAPEKIYKKGFQGFRYTTKLF